MFLTKEDYEKIEKYLKQNAKRDSQFPELESETGKSSYQALGEDDRVVVNHLDLQIPSNDKYRNTTVNLKNLLNGALYSNVIEDIIQNSDKLVTSGAIFNGIKNATTNIPKEHLKQDLQDEINSAVKELRITSNNENPVRHLPTNGVIDLTFNYAKSVNADGTSVQHALSANGASSAVQVSHPLKFGSKEYNGSSTQVITATDLGIGNIYNFIGVSTTDPTVDGATVVGYVGDWRAGTTVRYRDYSYILLEDGNEPSHWENVYSAAEFVTKDEFAEWLQNYYDKYEVDEGFVKQPQFDEYSQQIYQIIGNLENTINAKLNTPDPNNTETLIPYEYLSERVQEAIDTAEDLSGMIKPEDLDNSTIEFVTKKINNWDDLDTEPEDPTVAQMFYPTARMTKQSIDEVKDIATTNAQHIGDYTTIVHTENGKVPSELLPASFDMDAVREEIYRTISQELGDEEQKTISQKTLTESINRIWQKIEEITGESYRGLNMSVNPLWYFGAEGCDVNIVATSAGNQGPFEKLEFYTNGVKVIEQSNIDFYEGTIHINGTTEIMCKAKIRGEEGSGLYEKKAIIKQYDSFYICAADAVNPDFTNVIGNANYTVDLNEGRSYSKNVIFSEDGQKLYILMDPNFDIIRADMNGFEIPMTESRMTIQDIEYRVYISNNLYQAGTYNIDITR